MNRCYKCKQEKETSELVEANGCWECKACKNTRSQLHYQQHRAEVILRTGLYAKTHPDIEAKKRRKWSQANPGKVAASAALRRARILQATPRWLTRDQILEIQDIYIKRPKGYHVDHIYPLKSDVVCGLHVPWNLQYLPASENSRKGNR